MKELKDFLKQYSFDDLAKVFFTLNLWLPNISSPIKSQFLYLMLEEVCSELSSDNKICNYEDFVSFSKKIIGLVPAFSSIEDYVPEADWGDIKYYYDKEFYKVFYGGDLSNPYDFYTSFELIHKPFEDYYLRLKNRSPFLEFKLVLGLQDYIIKNLSQQTIEDTNLRPGDFSVPSKEFWQASVKFINDFEPQNIFDKSLVDLYTKECDAHQKEMSVDDFGNCAFEGKNCLYFFARNGDKYYPVLPRRYFSVILEKWGAILRENYDQILKLEEKEEKKPEYGVHVEIKRFLSRRLKENEFFGFASPVDKKQKSHEQVFIAIHSKDKLFLVFVTPPSISKDVLKKYFIEITPKIIECQNILKEQPVRLRLHTQQMDVQFKTETGQSLKPIFIALVPYCTTEPIGIPVPKGFDAEVMGLDQFVGLIDELKNVDELSEFYDYKHEVEANTEIPALNSTLDLFGSFRDSYGVLIAGADRPNFVMLDFGWGSSIRYRTLKDFWSEFPENEFFGHPRSWHIPINRKRKNGFILDSRTYKGYAYYQRVKSSAFYINAPVHLMDFEQGTRTDSLMHALADAIDLYPEILSKIEFAKQKNKIQIMFFPDSLVKTEAKLDHVKHLLQKDEVWNMDVTPISPTEFGIRVVFNVDMTLKALLDVKDRSMQIQLLIDVVKKIGEVWEDPEQATTIAELEKEKSGTPRFKTKAIEKKVAFPPAIKVLKPDEREYKLAEKVIAMHANEISLKVGTYEGQDAKDKLSDLTNKIIETINSLVAKFNFTKSVPILLEKVDALVDEHERDEEMVKISLEHEVDYERVSWTHEKYRNFIGLYRSYRYLVEKFVQLQPKEEQVVNPEAIKELIALIDRLLDIRSVSDFLKYEIHPIKITIQRDFIVTMDYGDNMGEMQKELGEERARIQLGIIGNDEDVADFDIPVDEYLTSLDDASKKDFGFSFKDMINLLQVLSMWCHHREGVKEDTFYFATLAEISETCAKGIKGFDINKTSQILDFLELKSENILKIEEDARMAPDLPVWEHSKRLTRYNIRPLIKVGEKYYWGPHSTFASCRTWMNTTSNHRLPADFPNTPTISAVLESGHRSVEASLVKKTKEVVERLTPNVKTDVFPHHFDSGISDIGDFDVLAYLKDKNILINIESKLIDPVYSNKDLQRVQRKIFGRTASDGSFKKGYIQKVEERDAYLKKEYAKVMTHCGWELPKEPPKVVSVFLTKASFWWTKFPPIKTDIKFVQLKLLEDLLKKLL